MKPITYTYDWGMVTDLARRNIARICGKLGLENILISADIKQKRRNIQLNVEAWLKQPELGIIPLFMAGDKQFFSYVNKVKRETGIIMDIWSMNRLENTDFKNSDFDKQDLIHLLLIYIHYPNVFRKIYDTETKGGRGFFSLVTRYDDGYPPGGPNQHIGSEYKNSTYYT